ncbi:MAG: hypothetical protein EOP21_12290, partial [Hyphomicrobiales bacterium]
MFRLRVKNDRFDGNSGSLRSNVLSWRDESITSLGDHTLGGPAGQTGPGSGMIEHHGDEPSSGHRKHGGGGGGGKSRREEYRGSTSLSSSVAAKTDASTLSAGDPETVDSTVDAAATSLVAASVTDETGDGGVAMADTVAAMVGPTAALNATATPNKIALENM